MDVKNIIKNFNRRLSKFFSKDEDITTDKKISTSVLSTPSEYQTNLSNGEIYADKFYDKDGELNFKGVMNKIYPVNSIYITMNDSNPSDILGVGTWERIANGKTLWGGDGTNTGTELKAGIPNVIGSLQHDDNQPSWVTGAFYTTDIRGNGAKGGGADAKMIFDLSRGETKMDGTLKTDSDYKVYGKSETVQPPALIVNIWRRIA